MKMTLSGKVFLLMAVCTATLITCTTKPKTGAAHGEELARTYCASCHKFVPAETLDSATWSGGVLPNMALRLGIRVWGTSYFQPNAGDHPTVPYQDFMDIVAYYQTMSPKTMPASKLPTPLVEDWSIFRLKRPADIDTSHDATTCLVKWDSAAQSLITGHEESSSLITWDSAGRQQQEFRMPSAPVYASLYRDPRADTIERTFTCIGQMIATDGTEGRIVHFNPFKKENPEWGSLAGFLPRPVQAVPGDFNKDGLTDYIVCGFGHEQGALLRMTQQASHQYSIDTIRNVPGAIQARVGDYNNDGWPDVMVLFAHAQEGIWLFLNNQHGGFTTKNLLEFLPVWGSSSFDYTDVNGDGRPDIVYTCGDNADYSIVLKPFHGMYIFLNEGDMHFKQSYFFPLHGCYKAMAADFDGDGDMDIATIAFFNDYANTPQEGFVYFEQDKPMHFVPHAVPVYKEGRWICMDVADVDKDGDLDIILGNYSKGLLEQGSQIPWNKHVPYIVLENRTK